MISTVTTSTITTVSSAASTNPGLAGVLTLVAVLVFLALVVQKELTLASSSSRCRNLARGLNIGLVPFGIGFLMIAGARLIQLLG